MGCVIRFWHARMVWAKTNSLLRSNCCISMSQKSRQTVPLAVLYCWQGSRCGWCWIPRTSWSRWARAWMLSSSLDYQVITTSWPLYRFTEHKGKKSKELLLQKASFNYLKGQCHQIFCFRFFFLESSFPKPLKITSGSFQNLFGNGVKDTCGK